MMMQQQQQQPNLMFPTQIWCSFFCTLKNILKICTFLTFHAAFKRYGRERERERERERDDAVKMLNNYLYCSLHVSLLHLANHFNLLV
jgi:hypothetical protein